MTHDIEKTRFTLGDKKLSELGVDSLWTVAARMSKSDLVPKEMRGRPENVYMAALWARENNVPLVQALQGTYVVNGRLSVYGDLFLALVQRSPDYVRHHEQYTGTPYDDDFTAICRIWRRGHEEPFVGEFSVADAKRANLWMKRGRNGQDTPWITYPRRMLMMRARTFAGRDGFADALKGITSYEEAADIAQRTVDVEDVTPGRRTFGGAFSRPAAGDTPALESPPKAEDEEAPAADATTTSDDPGEQQARDEFLQTLEAKMHELPLTMDEWLKISATVTGEARGSIGEYASVPTIEIAGVIDEANRLSKTKRKE